MADSVLPVADTALPEDLSGRIRAFKQAARQEIGDVEGLLATVESFIERELDDMERDRAAGRDVWPQIEYCDVRNGRVSAQQVQQLRRRGCVVIRNHFSPDLARDWDNSLETYLDDNDFDRVYKGMGDDFFGTLAASRPPILPIYWSPAQMQARQHERMTTVQSFLNRLWRFESQGQTWFDPDRNLLYPDRVRRRPPGTSSAGLGAHTDSGSVERWLHPGYQQVYRQIYAQQFELYDPWDAAWRPGVEEYGGSTMCSAFRTFQGWTALADMPAEQGCLHTVPIPAAVVYALLRPLLDDVPQDSLCGAVPGHVLPIDETWHPLLLRGLSSIPQLQAGDSVWWHCDLIHAVAGVENQQGWSNVMYVPAAPWCERNAAYAQRVRVALGTGQAPGDFPATDYETGWSNRFQVDQLNRHGRRGLGLDD